MGCSSSNSDLKFIDEPYRRKCESNGKAKIADAACQAAKHDATNNGETQNPYMHALTPKDTFHLKMSWKGIRRSLEITGVTMFIK